MQVILMMNKLIFEHIIKEKAANYEIPMQQGAWNDFASKANLSAKGAGLITGTALKIALIASLFVIPAVSIYFLMDIGKQEKDKLINKDLPGQENVIKENVKIIKENEIDVKIEESVIENNSDKEDELNAGNYIFTPIENGKQILFGPREAGMENIMKFRMLIRDENGKLIFESNSKYDLWDGKVGNTDVYAKNGTYDWFIVIVKPNDDVYRKSGKVKLLR